MADITEVSKDGRLLALIFRREIKSDGVRFLTPTDFPLQLGLIEHPKGKKIRPHIHRDLKYRVNTTQEFLYVEQGSARVTIYDKSWKRVKDAVLNKGDFILFISGGHSLEILNRCRILEIKQGPYPGDRLAKIFKEQNECTGK